MTDISSWRCSVVHYCSKWNSLCNTHICRIKQPNHQLLDPEDEGTAILRNIRTFSETSGKKNMQSNASKKTDNLIHWMDLCLKQRKSRSTETTNTITHTVFACYDSGCRQRVAACGDDRGTQTQHKPSPCQYESDTRPCLSCLSVTTALSAHHTNSCATQHKDHYSVHTATFISNKCVNCSCQTSPPKTSCGSNDKLGAY